MENQNSKNEILMSPSAITALTKALPEVLTEDTKAAFKKEKQRLLELLLKETPDAVNIYKAQIKHAGGLLVNSMGFAYEKGLRDAFKILGKENKI